MAVAVPVPAAQLFTYRCDGPPPPPGTRLLVPFRQSLQVGWAAGPAASRPGARNVLSVLESEPLVPGDLLALARWVSGYYVAPLGVVLKAMTPAGLTDRSHQRLVALRPLEPGDDIGRPGQRVLAALGASPRGKSVAAVRRLAGSSGFWPAVRKLAAQGIVGHSTALPRLQRPRTRRAVRIVRQIGTLEEMDRLFGRAARQREAYERLKEAGGRMPLAALLDGGFSRAVVAGLVARGVAETTDETVARDPFREGSPGAWADADADADANGTGRPKARASPLTPAPSQKRALAPMRAALGKGGAFLLHGVTGSGKTLVYVELLKDVLARREDAIVLVPEIALTPQTVGRFREAFGDLVAVLHSGLSTAERYDAWRLLRSGEKRVAIGARSAVFAPVARLGAIVVDEEHDGGYKQSEAPCYQARDVALVRAAQAGALCVLGSATPSLESWANAKSGKLALLSMPERVGGGSLPDVRVADLRVGRGLSPGLASASELAPARDSRPPPPASGRLDRNAEPESAAEPPAFPPHVISAQLADAIRARLPRREQVILLLNRRGYASFALCRVCGAVRECGQCSVSMTLHRGRRELVCHHCGRSEAVPEQCMDCGSAALSYRGLGTEQVERVLVEAVPGVRVARMDTDTTGGKWSRHEILGRVRDGAVDVLVGTQMVAKGLDFHRVTLVGVVNADIGLHLPDFRASERTFQLLSQVAGRTGRGKLRGEVVIQTYVPDHHVIRAVVAHDYLGFVERELQARRNPPYPPTMRLARVVASGRSRAAASEAAQNLAKWIRRRPGQELQVLGPAPAPIEKRKDRFRWHLLLRGSPAQVGRTLRSMAGGEAPGTPGVRLLLDRDPAELM